MKKLAKHIPLLHFTSDYGWGPLRTDAMAGFLVAIVLMPQAVAYSFLAGMPAEYGLYASIFPAVLYGFFGTCPQISLGPVAISSILILSVVSMIAEPFSSEYISLVILLGLIVGISQYLIGLFRLGFLVNFMSLPVLSGVITGAACIIIISQISPLLGIANVGVGTLEKLKEFGLGFTDLNWTSSLIGLLATLVVVISKKWKWKVPGTLLVVVFFTTLTFLLRLDETHSVQVVGAIEGGLPGFQIPQINVKNIEMLLPAALVLTLINCVESLTIAKGVTLRNKSIKLRANKELRSTGLVKLISSFFQALPASASFSRSAIYEDRGVVSGVASILTGCIVLVTVLFFSSAIHFIPISVLAAIIISSVLPLIDINYGRELSQIKRSDFTMYLSALFICVFVGIEYGVLFGVLFSFALMLYKSSRPKSHELGLIENTDTYRNVKRFKKAIIDKRYIIVRFDARLYFANADFFLEKMMKYYRKRKGLKYFVLCAENINQLDTTGLHVLTQFAQAIQEDDVQLLITGAKGEVRDLFAKSDFYNTVPKQHHFMKIADAVRFVELDDRSHWHSGAIQADI